MCVSSVCVNVWAQFYKTNVMDHRSGPKKLKFRTEVMAQKTMLSSMYLHFCSNYPLYKLIEVQDYLF